MGVCTTSSYPTCVCLQEDWSTQSCVVRAGDGGEGCLGVWGSQCIHFAIPIPNLRLHRFCGRILRFPPTADGEDAECCGGSGGGVPVGPVWHSCSASVFCLRWHGEPLPHLLVSLSSGSHYLLLLFCSLTLRFSGYIASVLYPIPLLRNNYAFWFTHKPVF